MRNYFVLYIIHSSKSNVMRNFLTLLIFVICVIFDALHGRAIAEYCFVLPLVMGGISAATSILGSTQAAKAARENQKILKGLQDENKSNYLSEYYRGALDNPGSLSYLKRLDENLRDRTKATENTAIATGATQENVLAQKEANNQVLSNAVGDLVQNEDARKQQVKSNYFTNKANLSGMQMGQNSQKAQNWMNLASNITQAAGSLASTYLMDDAKLFSQRTSTAGNLPAISAPSAIVANNAAPAVSNVPKPVIK